MRIYIAQRLLSNATSENIFKMPEWRMSSIIITAWISTWVGKKTRKGKTVCSRNRKEKKGNERNLKPLLVTVRCFQLWENCSKERVEVFHDHLRLTTTDVSCQVWQNRRERAPGNNLPFGKRLAKHRRSKRKDLGIKMWAHATPSERRRVSRRQHFQGDPTVQSGAGLPWVAFVPFPCAPWASPVSHCWLWGEDF